MSIFDNIIGGSLTIEDKIVSAKTYLIREHPFFGYALLRIPVVPSSKANCISGMKIVIRDDIIEECHVRTLAAIIAHELLHFLLKHHERAKEFRKYLEANNFPSEDVKDYHYKMNIAEDIVINAILYLNGFNLPEWCILPKMVQDEPTVEIRDAKGQVFTIKQPHKKSAEEVYLLIKDGYFMTSSFCDIYNDPPAYFDPGESEKEESQSGGRDKEGSDKIDPYDILTRAYTYAKMQGKEPAGLGEIIKNIFKPKVNWRALLRKYLTALIPSDYSYLKPNKKSPENIILPSVAKSDKFLMKGIFATDSSGSISKTQLEQFISELYHISREFLVDIVAIVCDAAVQQEVRIKSPRDVEYLIKLMKERAGRGGTDFRPVFERAEKYRPLFLIYLTDGYGTFPEKPPRYPVIWVVTKDGLPPSEFPFGKVIRIDV